MEDQELLEAVLMASLDLASKGEVKAVQNLQRLLEQPDELGSNEKEIDAQWDALGPQGLEHFKVVDVPPPAGEFPDLDIREVPPDGKGSEFDRPNSRPSIRQLLKDVASHGFKVVSHEYGIPAEQLARLDGGRGPGPKSDLPVKRGR